jgi:hypothetical protein
MSTANHDVLAKRKTFPIPGIKPCLYDPESVILTGPYTCRKYISQVKFFKFLTENSRDYATQTIGHIEVEMNKLLLTTYRNGKDGGSGPPCI